MSQVKKRVSVMFQNISRGSMFLVLSTDSTTLIRAETERYDIVSFSKVTIHSLASGTGS